MSKTNPDQVVRELPVTQRRRLRWFVDPDNGRLLLPVSGLWILGLDWLLFSSNVLSLGIATPVLIFELPWPALFDRVKAGGLPTHASNSD